MNPEVRSRLTARTGRIIEWFAQPDSSDGRPRAWLLGSHALAIAEPRLRSDHRRIYAVHIDDLDPASFRTKHIDHRPGPGHHPPRRAANSDRRSINGLSADTSGILGNLPPTAQELLQAPFLDNVGLVRNTGYYEGTDDHLSPVLLILAGRKHVTAAFGTRTIPAGHNEATAHWTLTCIRATTSPRS